MKLQFDNVRVSLAEFTLEVSTEMHGRIIGIAGPSGAGKTTLLDVVAGIRPPCDGRVVLDDATLDDTRRCLHIPVRARRMGYVPQDLGLFPHLTVRRNLLYGYDTRTEPSPLFRFDHVVEVLEIDALIARDVNQLSGGEKQRVSLARALLSSPRLLLLDEPLSSLDRALKAQIILYLKRVRDEFQLPMLLVSHNTAELEELCDTAFTLNRGRIEAPGSDSTVSP